MIVNNRSIPTGPRSLGARAAEAIIPWIEDWYGTFLCGIYPSGSYAKDTAIEGGSDIDLFVSLSSTFGASLRDIFMDFGRCLRRVHIGGEKVEVRRQNVSQCVTLNGVKIDFVPARRQSPTGNRHHIHVRRQNTYTLTDVTKHIALVQQSGRQVEIKAVKIWRELNGLEFPSFLLELVVIDALYGRRVGRIEDNLCIVFDHLHRKLLRTRIVDPGNGNNVVSHGMSNTAKRKVSNAARRAWKASNWEDVIW